MNTVSARPSSHIALFVLATLLAWKIFEMILHAVLWFLTDKNQAVYGRFDFYVVSPLVLIVAAFFIGRAVTWYTQVTTHRKLLPYVIIGVVVVQALEFMMINRLYGLPFSFSSRFIGILFETGIFALFFLLGARRTAHFAREN